MSHNLTSASTVDSGDRDLWKWQVDVGSSELEGFQELFQVFSLTQRHVTPDGNCMSLSVAESTLAGYVRWQRTQGNQQDTTRDPGQRNTTRNGRLRGVARWRLRKVSREREESPVVECTGGWKTTDCEGMVHIHEATNGVWRQHSTTINNTSLEQAGPSLLVWFEGWHRLHTDHDLWYFVQGGDNGNLFGPFRD
jgi:hypothetical protein